MKKTKNNEKIIIVLAFALILLVGFVFYSQKNTSMPQQATPVNQTKLYQSENLKFSIQVPVNYQIEDTGITVSLKSDKGEISISRNGTQFTNLTEYLKDFDQKRKLKIEEENKLSINGFEATSRIEEFTTGLPNRHKIYFIFVGSWGFSTSTTSEVLFADLDQIAHSFRYTPTP